MPVQWFGMKRILVIGATGNIGGRVAAQLAAAGVCVRALTRKPEIAGFLTDVDVVLADLTIPESLDGPLDGIDAVFLVWTAPATAVAAALERIVKHAPRIVYLSAPLKTPHPLFQQPNPGRTVAQEIERLIEASGVEWTFLRPGMFAGNAREWWGRQIREGDVVRWPYAGVPTAPIDERDIAAVAVRALLEDGHSGAEYVLTGPQSLTQGEQVATIGRAIGRPLRMEQISPEDARREWLPTWPAPVVDMLLNAWAAAAGHPAHVTNTVREITGKPARAFFDWARDHAAEFRKTAKISGPGNSASAKSAV